MTEMTLFFKNIIINPSEIVIKVSNLLLESEDVCIHLSMIAAGIRTVNHWFH